MKNAPNIAMMLFVYSNVIYHLMTLMYWSRPNAATWKSLNFIEIVKTVISVILMKMICRRGHICRNRSKKHSKTKSNIVKQIKTKSGNLIVLNCDKKEHFIFEPLSFIRNARRITGRFCSGKGEP